MHGRTLWTVLVTLAVALVVVVLGAIAFIYSGAYDIAATNPHSGPVRWAFNTTLERSLESRAGSVPQAPPVDSAALAEGFHHFSEMCVVCHGAPGVERGEFGEGLNPEPPELHEEEEDYSDQELFWLVKNGIRMTGMPAFGPTHSDDEIWGIVAFVKRLPEMSPEAYQEWVARYDSAPAGEAEAEGDGHTHTHTSANAH